MKRVVHQSLGLCIALLLFACSGHAQQDVSFESATVTMAGNTYQVEFAKSFEQRARGLMFRETLCSDCGMLFHFTPPKRAGMWMKNTLIPLDVAFIDEQGVITDIKPLQPHDLTSVSASQTVSYALEMNQGWFATHNIQEGDQIIINHE
ncbi:DUF192 domain-containing protein [Alteromonas halophila]|uniref:DUF192 domain-containing protein n=1 Tax=Alteromonas halophila TaxID=516698 RepID=A0A918JHM7_9ALTE|nr:DUF192 domain-containing protein [Alteromonas halophila]GGW80714.1 hypothetical protein GCM10007391_12080 [Alteromonas halophila]